MTETTNNLGRDADHGPAAASSPSTSRSRCSAAYIDYAMAVIVGRALPDVRDGLKPVHRRILYAMYDGGYRPDRGFSKCSRVVGDVMGQYHPHGDTAIYDTMVRLAQPWVMRAPLVNGQGNFGSPGNDSAAAMRYTECRMAPLAIEMVRDIDAGHRRLPAQLRRSLAGADRPAVALPQPAGQRLGRHRGRHGDEHPAAQPARGLRGRPLGARAPRRDPRGAAGRAHRADQGPRLPDGLAHRGPRGHRAGLPHRSRLDHPARRRRDRRGLQGPHLPGHHRAALHGQPRQPRAQDRRARRLRRIQGIADVRDDTSSRTGQRLVVVLKRDAVARVVLNNLFKHTELQTNFSANMLALVDYVPRTLTIDQFISNWVAHQIEVIQRRTRYRLAEAEKRAHIYRGLVKALDALDEVIALIRRCPDVDEARDGLIELLDIDERAGRRHPRDAAAPPGRPRAPEDHRPARRDRARDRRPRGHPGQRDAPAADRHRRALRDRREVRHRPPFADHRGRRGPVDGGPDPRRGARRLDHPRRLRQAHPAPASTAPRSAAARACAARPCAATTWSSTSSPPPTTTGCCSSPRPVGSTAPRPTTCPRPRATRRAATSPGCCRSSPTRTSPRCWRSATTSRRPTSCSRPATAWSRRPASATTTARARPASSRSTSARTTTR